MAFVKMNMLHGKRTRYRNKSILLIPHLYAHNKVSAGVRAEAALGFAFQALWLLRDDDNEQSMFSSASLNEAGK